LELPRFFSGPYFSSKVPNPSLKQRGQQFYEESSEYFLFREKLKSLSGGKGDECYTIIVSKWSELRQSSYPRGEKIHLLRKAFGMFSPTDNYRNGSFKARKFELKPKQMGRSFPTTDSPNIIDVEWGKFPKLGIGIKTKSPIKK